MIMGQTQRAVAHMNFNKKLENPNGFAQALQNVNIRTGGVKPLDWTLPNVKVKDRRGPEATIPAPSEESEGVEQSSPEGWEPVDDGDNTTVVTRPAPSSTEESVTVGPSSQSSGPLSKSRWDELRAANAKSTAVNSSWDALRQTHERQRITPNNDNSSSSTSSTTDAFTDTPFTRVQSSQSNTNTLQTQTAAPPDDERTIDQAHFDAMLEAERKMARGE